MMEYLRNSPQLMHLRLLMEVWRMIVSIVYGPIGLSEPGPVSSLLLYSAKNSGTSARIHPSDKLKGIQSPIRPA